MNTLKTVTVGLLGMTIIEVIKAKKEDKSELLAVAGIGLVGFGILATKGDEKAMKFLKKAGEGLMKSV